jgi:5'(3')-deoxyribonucleotidase
MDEVLVDFVGGALRIHGWTRQRLEQVRPPGSWSIVEPMGMTPAQFWRPINAAGESFWLGLQLLPWASRVVDWVRSVTPDWYIVSSPSSTTSSYAGKLRWLRRYFGRDFQQFVLTSHKHLLAQPTTLLIDDREETVQQFITAGGEGLLFPSRHNRLWSLADDPVTHLSFLYNAIVRRQYWKHI